jgi:hypothetical protein
VDEKAIDGHMINGRAIFLGVNDEGNNKPYPTLAGADSFPVPVTLEKIRNTNTCKTESGGWIAF